MLLLQQLQRERSLLDQLQQQARTLPEREVRERLSACRCRVEALARALPP